MRRCGACACVLLLLGCGADAGAGAGASGEPAPHGEAAAGSAAQPGSESEPAPPSPGAARAVAFTCDEQAGADAAPDGLRRLTMTQYRNTLRDLARWALGDPVAADAALASAGLASLPVDRREPTLQEPHGSYRRLDQALEQRHVDETYRIAVALGSALATPERLAALAGACASDDDLGNDRACASDFIARFGERALRRPLAPDDTAFYLAVFGSDPTAGPAGYADVIAVMLSSPEFLYFVEHGEAELPDRPGSYRLSAYELAARLSYHFWQTLPDEALWQTAEDGSLLQPEVLAQQIERLLADARARATMAELFSDLLGLEDLPQLDAHAHDPLFAAFAGSDLPGPELRRHAIDEALDMLAHFTWTDPQGLDALLTSELSFARGEDLARLYGVQPWDGSSAPPALPAGERAGLLTRAWFLASGSANTRPIKRGVFVRRRLLCDELPPPPAGADAMPLPARADRTTRQVVEELTEQPGGACASCHASLINPLGFAFEGFDALGRVRVEQLLYDETGALLGALPVDTATVPRVTPDDVRVSQGPADLSALLLESGKLEACLARHYFRFAFGRQEDERRDGCALERLRARLAETGRLRDLLAEVALLPELQARRFSP
jgi:hypothetical protein